VASAGNAARDVAGVVPAAYQEVLTVSAMADTDGRPGATGPAPCAKGERDDRAWSGSNFAVAPADGGHLVAAAGVCVVSTKLKGGTTTMTGTSMAAPAVTGTVALCVGTGGTPGPCAGLAPRDIVERIRGDATAAAQDPTWGGFAGDPFTPLPVGNYGSVVSAAAYPA